MIYMDNAATHLGNFGQPNVNSPYAIEYKNKFEDARKEIGMCLNCDPERIYFTSGGCESNSWALQRCGCKTIVTTKIEHPSILNCCEWLEKNGYTIHYLDVDEHGYVDMLELDQILNDIPAGVPVLVSIMAVNNEIGTVQDLRTIRKFIDYHNELRIKKATETLDYFTEHIYFHTDAVQAIGHIPIDINLVDMLSASGHKFGTDTGVGFLYSRIPLQPLIFGGSQEKNLRGGTSNYDAVVRMAGSLDGKCSNSYVMQHCQDMIAYLRRRLSVFDCIFNTPEESTSNILSVSFKDVDAEKLMAFLTDFEVYVSAGSACHTDHKEASHVLKAIGVPQEYINGTIRFSVSELIGEKHIDYVVSLINQFVLPKGESNE